MKTRRERPKSAPYLRLKNIQGTTIGNIWKNYFFQKKFEIFFSKKSIFLESRTMPKNSKRGHSGSLNVFTNRKLQKNAIDRFRKFSKKKSHSAEKNEKKSNETKQSFGLASTFGSIKNLWFSARIEPTIPCFSEN